MDIKIGYKNDDILRNSLAALARETFGIDLESWYERGLWSDDYIPYSVIEDGKVVSNISINVCNIRSRGKIHHLAQLCTVMTDPGYRQKGCAGLIMEKLLPDCDRSFEGTYLYADRSMAGFYEKFGFTQRDEYQCGKEVNISNPCSAEKIPMTSKEEQDRMVDIIQRWGQYGDKIMVGNPGLFMFNITGPFSDCVYYLPDSDSYVIARIDDDKLSVYAAFSEAKVSLGDVISSFGSGIRYVDLKFTPENNTGFLQHKIEDDENVLFVRGEFFESRKNEKFMFPMIAQS